MTTHRNILLTLLVSLTLSSCNLLGPVDDIQPDFVLTDDDVITDSNSAEYLLNGTAKDPSHPCATACSS